MAGFLAPSLLIDKKIILDAGSFSSVLSLEQQLQVDHVLLSHAHCDHTKDLALFADLIIGRKNRPVKVHASAGAMKVIRKDFFNNRMWPDFFALPNPERPVLKEAIFEPGQPFRIGDIEVRAVLVSHPVESVAFIVRGPGGSFVYTGDTGPTEELWQIVNRLRGLKLLMIETKFPNDMQVIADAAGHLTPRTLQQELKKLNRIDVPISLYHLKPDRIEDIVREVGLLQDPRIGIMKIGDCFTV
jgi:ribonuclease BN (tRNA processing enzyme)